MFDDSSPYYENVIVNKSINLIGEDRDTTVIDGKQISNTIRIINSGVNISGFTIKHGSINARNLPSNIVISGNHFINRGGFGISFWSTDNSFIISNTFTDCDWSIFLDCGNNNIISNNIFIFNYSNDYHVYEIYCLGDNHVITNNTIINLRGE